MIAIAVIAVILIGGGIYWSSMVKPVAMNPATSQNSIRALMAKGQPMKCQYNPSAATAGQSGTIYLSGEKMRGDFTIIQNGQEFKTSIIRDGQWMYSWSGAMNGQGTKVKVTAQASGTAAAEANKGFDVDQPLDANCTAWQADASVFTPPSNVTFQDLSAQIQGNTNVAAPKVDCSVCNSAPAGEARQQCLAALKC